MKTIVNFRLAPLLGPNRLRALIASAREDPVLTHLKGAGACYGS
jgi:hypothetical protein